MESRPAERLETGDAVVVQYYKYSGDLHWRHDLRYLGDDAHGRWLSGPVGTTVQRGHEPPQHWPTPFVQLISPDRWWTMFFNGSHADDYRVYVDVITPAEWITPARVEMVDLDLDVVMHHDGSAELLDEDEFRDHSKLFAYPDSVIDRARVTAAELMLKVDAYEEPFGSAGERWLRIVER